MKTDAQLQLDVMAELKWEPAVHAAQIGVEAQGGVVTLTGHVSSYAEKWHAEKAAQRVSGVEALAVEIAVNLPAHHKRNDTDIAHAAKQALQWTSYWPNDCVMVMVEHGMLTLTGEVAWDYQRQAAAWAVTHLLGVTGVSNQIMLKPEVSPGDVKADIEAALRRRANGDSHKIRVEVSAAQVTLCGSVHSWAERDLATHAAWGTPGVRDVVNNLHIAY